MTQTIINTYESVNSHRTLIVRALFAGCVMAALWYGINVYSAISRTIAAEHISTQTAELGNAVNKLGSQYIQLANKASPSVLSSYGMSQSPVAAYITRTPSLGIAKAHEF